MQALFVFVPLYQERHIVRARAATRAPFPLRTARDGCFAAGHCHHCQHPLPLAVQRSPVARRHHALHLRMGPKQSQIAVITGASSGVGLYAARALINKGNGHIVMASRDVDLAERAANSVNLPKDAYTVLHCDLADFASVLKFVRELSSVARVDHLDALICNAAIWHPRDKKPRFTVDGIEETMQVCHLSHLLLCRELLPKLKISRGRIVFLTTQTHSPNSLPGKIPPQARLGDISGLAAGLDPQTTDMVESGPFEPTKAFKDAKAENVLTMKALSDRYGRDGVTSVAIFPGCVAESNLFREKRG
jgi:protochlorophyllide reductase